MHGVLHQIFKGSREGMSNTEVDFGTLQNHSPVTIKLDLDPEPLEESEIVLFVGTSYILEDIGTRLALIRCSNGQYLVLGKVN